MFEVETKRAVHFKSVCFYVPTMMAVDLYSGLKGQRLRPSSITTSPTSSLSSVNVDVFWKRETELNYTKLKSFPPPLHDNTHSAADF